MPGCGMEATEIGTFTKGACAKIFAIVIKKCNVLNEMVMFSSKHGGKAALSENKDELFPRKCWAALLQWGKCPINDEVSANVDYEV